MKKLLVALSILPLGLFSFNSFGQISSGTVMVGGGLGGSISTTGSGSNNQEFKNTSLSISPMVGFFVANNLALGLDFKVDLAKQKASSIITLKNNSYNFGPFVRYYKFLGEKTAIYGDAAVIFSRTINKLRNDQNELVNSNKVNNFGVSITPGLTYFATPKIGLEITLGSINYFKNKTENLGEGATINIQDNSGFGLGFGLSNASLGIKFYVARR